MKIFALAVILSFSTCTVSNSNSEVPMTYKKPLLDILNENGLVKADVLVRIYKSKYTLEVWSKDEKLKSYPVVLGGEPVGQKLREGDLKTPEGTFKVRNLYPHKKWSKFIWFDYPNNQSRINHTEAKRNGIISENSTIGGEVGIHGVPEGADNWIEDGQNWTLGCISLTNADIDDLYTSLQVGTEIVIFP